MSIMIAEVYKALVEAGASEDSARAAAGAIPIAKDLATKEGLADVRAALKQDIADLKQDIAELRATLRYNTMFLMLVIGLLVKLVFFP